MKKLLHASILLGMILVSCKTTLPPRDTRPPEFILKIIGDGLNEEITEDFDFDNKALYLRREASYRVIFTFTDQGGLKEMSWIYSAGVISLGGETTAAGFLSIANSGDPYKQQRKWIPLLPDDSGEVYRSNIITYTDFKAIGRPPSGSIDNYEWEIVITDMRDNITNRKLVLRITDEPSRIGSID
ncbi:hypothetical protein POV27_00395 [Aureisphaera galaxeae]|uniref:hypothetical protein n=1 Tax=Aureisphaera galaxeae TaxID=1538023 RepID=UPI002350CCA3|nr:hypothetical protein [Aureisphaera galaxeae]MDC8002495.1 hypothetical protein [Aureisphaera galaxeae]